MDVSKKSGTPKSSILIGISIITHPFWGPFVIHATHPSSLAFGCLPGSRFHLLLCVSLERLISGSTCLAKSVGTQMWGGPPCFDGNFGLGFGGVDLQKIGDSWVLGIFIYHSCMLIYGC